MDFSIKIRNELFKLQDLKYLEFSQNISPEYHKKRIGIRNNILKSFAKKLLKEYDVSYLLENISEEYYEELLLKGYIIGNSKITINELIEHIKFFVPKIGDWSICDSFVCSLKVIKKYPTEAWKLIDKYLNSKKEFQVRFSLVMILNHFISDEYKNKIFSIIKNVSLDKYYVKMANAWLISYMIINYYDETIMFLLNNKFDIWTIKKGITKAIESYKISPNKKDELRKIRENIK